jgi:hypothetical protein
MRHLLYLSKYLEVEKSTTFTTLSKRLVVIFLLFFVLMQLNAQPATMRHPISPNQPMFLIHIDAWNNANPQKLTVAQV